MMEITGDIWKYHDAGFPIVITTNGFINKRAECVMGRGVALDMKQRYPEFPGKLATHIRMNGNRVGFFKPYNVFTFPTKHNWYEKSDLVLIEQSALHLSMAVNWLEFDKVYLVRPGCSNGKLQWPDVKPVIEKYFDERFIVVQNEI